jgi:hypothetical protein
MIMSALKKVYLLLSQYQLKLSPIMTVLSSLAIRMKVLKKMMIQIRVVLAMN